MTDKQSITMEEIARTFVYLFKYYRTTEPSLQKIANGCDNPQEVAKEALKEVTGEDLNADEDN